jgi:hypothetical protein
MNTSAQTMLAGLLAALLMGTTAQAATANPTETSLLARSPKGETHQHRTPSGHRHAHTHRPRRGHHSKRCQQKHRTARKHRKARQHRCSRRHRARHARAQSFLDR